MNSIKFDSSGLKWSRGTVRTANATFNNVSIIS